MVGLRLPSLAVGPEGDSDGADDVVLLGASRSAPEMGLARIVWILHMWLTANAITPAYLPTFPRHGTHRAHSREQRPAARCPAHPAHRSHLPLGGPNTCVGWN